jgi:hypothetical protein
MVPRAGIEPATRGFSTRPGHSPSCCKLLQTATQLHERESKIPVLACQSASRCSVLFHAGNPSANTQFGEADFCCEWLKEQHAGLCGVGAQDVRVTLKSSAKHAVKGVYLQVHSRGFSI